MGTQLRSHQRLLLCCVSSSASPRLPVATHLVRVRVRVRVRGRGRVRVCVRVGLGEGEGKGDGEG
jgi:hypothetical protein